MALLDVRTLPHQTRLLAAERIRTARDFDLGELEWFNSDPCGRHATLDEGLAAVPPCRRCGIRLRKHQRVGAAWLYVRGRGLIADQVGTGKTAQAAGLMALMKQTGEFDTGRVVVICRPSVLPQWTAELHRFLPKLLTVPATGTRKDRLTRYHHPWEILITGYQMFVRDLELLEPLPITTLIADDIDALRNPSNQTAYAIKRTARRCERTVVLTGTPLQKRLIELHSVLEPLGGLDVFGSRTAFCRRYLREELVKLYSPTAGRTIVTKKVDGYKNLDEFKAKVAPLVLRRTPNDIDDVDLPAISPHTVYLDLYAAQKQRYDELRRGVLKILKAEGTKVKRTTAVARFTYGAQICAGLTTLGEPDRPGTSAKLDWICDMVVDGDLSEEKVVVFAQFTNTIAALKARLDRAGVGNAVIWGRETDKTTRERATDRFWDDPTCRVLMGTTAIEQGLNLQVARHLINIDQIMNPARMQQLAGRIRRDGSAYKTVYVTNLLARGTQEEGYMDILSREQALADHIWGESNQLYEALPPLAMLHLIGQSGGRR